VAKAIEAEMKAEIAAKPIAEQPAEHTIVGLDGPLPARHARKISTSISKVVLGRIETVGRASEMYASVRDFDDLARERVRFALRKASRGPSTRLTKGGTTRLRRRTRHHGLSEVLNWDGADRSIAACAPRVVASKCERLDLFDAGKGLDLGKNRVPKDAIDLDERDRRAALAITAKGEGRDIDRPGFIGRFASILGNAEVSSLLT
jgi:hypothetical protein